MRTPVKRHDTVTTATFWLPCAAAIAVSTLAIALAACGGDDESVAPTPSQQSVVIADTGVNAVSTWNEIATTTITQPATTGGTPEEARPNYAVDLATVHLAIYDAVMAIARTHAPYAVTPVSPSDGASPDAATAAAAYGVLKALFPSRSAQYQSAYDNFVAGLADDASRSKGLALGAEVADKMVALRANDGRAIALPAFVSGTQPGQFRTATSPVGRENPFIRPFVTVGHSQFRAPGPKPLTSAGYAADVNETKALGFAASTTRTAEQTDIARFHTEAPPIFWTRNLRAFAKSSTSVADMARLMAMVWVTQADAANACFESKYFYLAWRPFSAITLDGDNNADTTIDASWTPVVPTPNHPEYPAAHGCVSGSTAEILRAYFGTDQITFDFASQVTGTTHHFTSATALVDEVTVARIAGGMHFRTALVDGEALGKSVADWVASHAFQKR